MSFFQSLKRMLGLDDDYDEIGIDATVSPRNSLQQSGSNESTPVDSVSEQNETQPARSLPTDLIFEHVVEVFNSALPDFLARSVDPAAQRKLLFDTLDESIKKQILDLTEEAVRESSARWQNERKKLMEEIDLQKDKTQKAEDSESDAKNRQLSAERQKRALNERIHDLEAQIARLEAEHEQFELENKSLINKIRVNSIQEGDNDALRQEIAELKTKLENAISKNGDTSDNPNENQQSLHDKYDSAIESLEQLKAKIELDDAMVRDLNSIAANAKQELKSVKEENERLTAELISLKNEKQSETDKISVAQSEIEELKQKLKDTSLQLQATVEELAEANRNLQVADEIQAQIERFEEIKIKKDAKIAELQNSRTNLIEHIRILENDCRSLKKTIEQNLMSQAKNESELKAEIEKLKSEKHIDAPEENTATSIMPATSPKPRQKRKKSPVKISAIDESLDNTDWLIATPPEGTTIRQSSKSENDQQFGYQEPIRKRPPENEAQMSLW